MSRFVARNAREIMMAKQDSFDRTLRTIRSMIDASIKDAAKLGKKSVTVNVPGSVFGHEPYNLAAMGKELANQLFADDYQVAGTYARMTISWADTTEKKRATEDGGGGIVIRVPKPRGKPN